MMEKLLKIGLDNIKLLYGDEFPVWFVNEDDFYNALWEKEYTPEELDYQAKLREKILKIYRKYTKLNFEKAVREKDNDTITKIKKWWQVYGEPDKGSNKGTTNNS